MVISILVEVGLFLNLVHSEEVHERNYVGGKFGIHSMQLLSLQTMPELRSRIKMWLFFG